MSDDFNKQELTDPENNSISTQGNNNDAQEGNFNQQLELDKRMGKQSVKQFGSGRKDDTSDKAFKSLQFKDSFGKMCSCYLKVKSDSIRHTDYTYLNAELSLTISPDPAKVKEQCVTFAVNAMNQAVDGYRIVGRRSYDDQISLIAEVYFYSFYKSIIAMWNGVQNGTSVRSLLFRGHAYVYRLAREGRRMYVDSSGPNVVKYIRFTDDQIETIKTEFEKEFLIARVAKEMIDLDGNFVIPAFENILNRMATGAFRLQGKNALMVMDDADNFVHNTLLSQSTCPLGNCFYDGSKKKLLVALDSTTRIKDFSYIANKASFITFDSYVDDYTEDNSSPPEFVTSISLNDNDYLVQDEVKYITGLDCLPQLSSSNYPDSYYPRKGDDLSNKMNSRDFGNFDMFRTTEPASESTSESSDDSK